MLDDDDDDGGDGDDDDDGDDDGDDDYDDDDDDDNGCDWWELWCNTRFSIYCERLWEKASKYFATFRSHLNTLHKSASANHQI